jgi:4-amino-4-deoxy-L-arabinose transferase-like glycosyltransferase
MSSDLTLQISAKSFAKFPVLIYLVALFVRLVPVLLTVHLPIGLDDMFQYDMLARSIVQGDGYRWYAEEELSLIKQFLPMEVPSDYDERGVLTSFRAPGYPAFLALVYTFFGTGENRFFAARLVQAILLASLAPLTWAIAHRLKYGEKTSRWAAGIIAFFPTLIIYPLALASENLFFVLLSLSLWLLLRADQGGKWLDYLLVGITLGGAALTRSIISGLLPVIILWLFIRKPNKKNLIRNVGVMLAGFIVMTVPWAVRNTLLHQQPTWVETSLGYNLYLGYHPESSGTFEFGISLDLLPILDDAERNAKGTAAALEFIRSAPQRLPYLMLRKAGYLWGLDKRALIYFYSNNLLGHWHAWLLVIAFGFVAGPLVIIAPLAVIGLVCGKMHREKILVGLLIGYVTLVHMLIMAESRFIIPLLPVLAILATSAVVEKPWKESSTLQRGLAIVLISLLVFNWSQEIISDRHMLAALLGADGNKLYFNY